VHKIPDGMSATAAAFVEPGSCALRAVKAAGVAEGTKTLVLGTGTLGLLAAQFARALKGDVCVAGVIAGQLQLAERLGFTDVVRSDELDKRQFACVIEATGAASVPQQALWHVEPGGRIALLGVAPEVAVLDAGRLVLNDLAVIGVLGGSAGIDDAIDMLASGAVVVEPLIAATIGLDDVAGMLERGCRIAGNDAPKIHVRPAGTGQG
jgi:threonine dehydrogenase-like Zn-dependent dehydrogenase